MALEPRLPARTIEELRQISRPAGTLFLYNKRPVTAVRWGSAQRTTVVLVMAGGEAEFTLPVDRVEIPAGVPIGPPIIDIEAN